MPQVRIFTDAEGSFRWKLRASDKSIVAKSGRAYPTKEECLQALKVAQKELTAAAVDPKVRTAVSASSSATPRPSSPASPRSGATAPHANAEVGRRGPAK
jgi:uncharacterized protein YegP (UPF0339 family)